MTFRLIAPAKADFMLNSLGLDYAHLESQNCKRLYKQSSQDRLLSSLSGSSFCYDVGHTIKAF